MAAVDNLPRLLRLLVYIVAMTAERALDNIGLNWEGAYDVALAR